MGVWTLVVYLLIPTSNHNLLVCGSQRRRLYIFWFLHQTTTFGHKVSNNMCCISFDSYIKPQRWQALVNRRFVVYLLIPTSNHNLVSDILEKKTVVYLLIPTSNHNSFAVLFVINKLYIFWFLHQTTTKTLSSKVWTCCISFDSYIKPQHIHDAKIMKICCISFDSYIKPQPVLDMVEAYTVVYLLIPTSNHNICYSNTFYYLLYIFWFLHQTTTILDIIDIITGCISFDSYIKPQRFHNFIMLV